MQYYNLDYNGSFGFALKDNPPNKKNNNRKKRPTKRKNTNDDDGEKNNKKPKIEFKNDKDLFKFIVDGSDNDNSDNSDVIKDERECPNPICDHKENKDHKEIEKPMIIKDVSDLIRLGKTYHCKNLKEYFGINLRILCKLVSPLTELENLVGMKKVKENIVSQIVFFLQGLNQKDKCGNCVDL
jgi:hypothetical protein